MSTRKGFNYDNNGTPRDEMKRFQKFLYDYFDGAVPTATEVEGLFSKFISATEMTDKAGNAYNLGIDRTNPKWKKNGFVFQYTTSQQNGKTTLQFKQTSPGSTPATIVEPLYTMNLDNKKNAKSDLVIYCDGKPVGEKAYKGKLKKRVPQTPKPQPVKPKPITPKPQPIIVPPPVKKPSKIKSAAKKVGLFFLVVGVSAGVALGVHSIAEHIEHKNQTTPTTPPTSDVGTPPAGYDDEEVKDNHGGTTIIVPGQDGEEDYEIYIPNNPDLDGEKPNTGTYDAPELDDKKDLTSATDDFTAAEREEGKGSMGGTGTSETKQEEETKNQNSGLPNTGTYDQGFEDVGSYNNDLSGGSYDAPELNP